MPIPASTDFAGRVEVILRNGDRIARSVPDRPGSPQSPLSAGAIDEEFTGLVEPVIGAAATARLRDQLQGLASIPTTRRLACQADPGAQPPPAG